MYSPANLLSEGPQYIVGVQVHTGRIIICIWPPYLKWAVFWSQYKPIKQQSLVAETLKYTRQPVNA